MCEQETFMSLLANAAHWEFELFLMLMFDGLIGAIAWPIAKRMWLRSQQKKRCCDAPHPHAVPRDNTISTIGSV